MEILEIAKIIYNEQDYEGLGEEASFEIAKIFSILSLYNLKGLNKAIEKIIKKTKSETDDCQ